MSLNDAFSGFLAEDCHDKNIVLHDTNIVYLGLSVF